MRYMYVSLDRLCYCTQGLVSVCTLVREERGKAVRWYITTLYTPHSTPIFSQHHLPFPTDNPPLFACLQEVTDKYHYLIVYAFTVHALITPTFPQSTLGTVLTMTPNTLFRLSHSLCLSQNSSPVTMSYVLPDAGITRLPSSQVGDRTLVHPYL